MVKKTAAREGLLLFVAMAGEVSRSPGGAVGVLFALDFLSDVAHGLSHVEVRALGGLHGHGLDHLTVHGGDTGAVFFAAGHRGYCCYDGEKKKYFLHNCNLVEFIGLVLFRRAV